MVAQNQRRDIESRPVRERSQTTWFNFMLIQICFSFFRGGTPLSKNSMSCSVANKRFVTCLVVVSEYPTPTPQYPIFRFLTIPVVLSLSAIIRAAVPSYFFIMFYRAIQLIQFVISAQSHASLRQQSMTSGLKIPDRLTRPTRVDHPRWSGEFFPLRNVRFRDVSKCLNNIFNISQVLVA